MASSFKHPQFPRNVPEDVYKQAVEFVETVVDYVWPTGLNKGDLILCYLKGWEDTRRLDRALEEKP